MRKEQLNGGDAARVGASRNAKRKSDILTFLLSIFAFLLAPTRDASPPELLISKPLTKADGLFTEEAVERDLTIHDA